MRMTLEFDQVTLIVHFGKYKAYSLLIDTLSGEVFRLTVPELIEALETVSKEKRKNEKTDKD